MTRLAIVAFICLLLAVPVRSQTRSVPSTPPTWYERILQRINPDDTDYGAIWEERKRELINQLGNPYFQYSLGATCVVILLLTIAVAQRLSFRRSLTIATQSLTDALCHDAYSRHVAEEAIRRHNDHIEGCNRIIELGQDGFGTSMAARESALQALKRQLADVRQENASLREELAKKSKQVAKESTASPAESTPAQHIDRIKTLEKLLREEQRKNQQVKGTSVDDHRA
jgi:regulator of replication initiation timing